MDSPLPSPAGIAQRRALGLAICVVMAALPAYSAVFRDARYGVPGGAEPAARLADVYTPESPGPHPVLVLLHGAVDKSAAAAWPMRLAGRDYVVYAVNHRSDANGALDDVVEALRFARRTASGYGGDARRVYLMGVGADARLAARAATAAAWDTDAQGAPKGTILLGDPGPWTGGRAVAPALLVQAEGDPDSRAATEAWAEHVQRQGVSAQVVAVGGSAGGASAGGAQVVDVVDAWLAASEIPRVQRFEHLVFAPSAVADLDGVVALATDPQALYAAAGNAIWRRASAGGDWLREREFDRSVACLQRWSGSLHVLLSSGTGFATSSRNASGQWSDPVQRMARDPGLQTPPLCLADPEGGLWIAAGRRLWHFGDATAARKLLTLDAAITGLAQVDGALVLASAAGDRIGAALWRLDDDGTARRVLSLPLGRPAWRHLQPVSDPEGADHEVLLGAEGERLVRYDLKSGHAPVEEIDLGAALRAQWGAVPDASPMQLASDFAALVHPETGELLHAAGLDALHPRRADPEWRGAWYLVRDAEGRYALGQVADPAASWPAGGGLAPIRAVIASPFVADAGRAAWFGGAAPGWLAQGRMLRAGPWQGLWWDPSHPGHGLLLQREGGNWLALFYTYDANGAAVWYRARLLAEGTELASDAAGLVAQRGPSPGAEAPAMVGMGRIALRLGSDAIDATCAESATSDGFPARAVLALDVEGRKAQWCLQPFRFAPPGLPRVAPRGLYGAEPGDSRWGLFVDTQGMGAAARSLAILFYFDRAGLPRWVLGSGSSARGQSEIELRRHSGACIGCGKRPAHDSAAGSLLLRFAGYCGEMRGAASLQLLQSDTQPLLVLRDVALAAATDAACY